MELMASLNADPSPVAPSRPLLSSMTQQATAPLDGDAQIPSPPIPSTDGPQFASSFPPKPSPAPWAEGLQEVCGRQGSGLLVGVALKYSKVLSWPLTSKQSVLRLEVAEHCAAAQRLSRPCRAVVSCRPRAPEPAPPHRLLRAATEDAAATPVALTPPPASLRDLAGEDCCRRHHGLLAGEDADAHGKLPFPDTRTCCP
ncbi:hypothetical protein OsI_33122 [Oryza sativa Indica Group]|uniref:Uncharacterized protein n=1 Tax=Oryza sativa subsp. indica TaxID=39946 RepID=B8BGA0_ORYSI|nr:hypothetical protein OsI_33122 [Oryza sativa Indica Group]